MHSQRGSEGGHPLPQPQPSDPSSDQLIQTDSEPESPPEQPYQPLAPSPPAPADSFLAQEDDDVIDDSSQDDVREEEEGEELIGDSDQEQDRRAREGMVMGNVKGDYKPIKLYDYQNILFNRSLNQNRIIYLPTGKGKTLVSIASMYYYLCKEGEDKKIVFLANTIQLVKQQADSIKRNLEKIIQTEEVANSLKKDLRPRIKWNAEDVRNKISCIHGEKNEDVGMTRRKKIEAELTSKKQILETFKKSTIIVMISQMFLNCLRRGYIRITDFSFMVFDQCHHCHGDHPYAGIMREFYFDPPQLDSKKMKILEMREQTQRMPVIMGLTASPVTQKTFDKNRIIREVSDLCGNLNSKFTSYEIGKDDSERETSITIVKAEEMKQERRNVPDLIEHFLKFRDHRESYDKIRRHFPKYFECVKEVVQLLIARLGNKMELETQSSSLYNSQHLLLYDIKQCLLVKIRDVWLQLGEYAFTLAFQQFYYAITAFIDAFKNDQNKDILITVTEIVKKYISIYRQLYGECEMNNFSGKVIQLIKILGEGRQHQNNEVEMVVVFAYKRRTVKYLQMLIERYKETLPEENKKSFESKKVTGYSVKNIVNYSNNQVLIDVNPSSKEVFRQTEKRFEIYMDQVRNQGMLSSSKQERQAESKNIASQIRRMKNVKYGKMLLEVEEKYSAQIDTIKKFRNKAFRVLITTSVTEQGFDIPECKIVISFDMPTSLKSYIQIKGRARQQSSRYYIFTTQRTDKQMQRDKNCYDDIIKATFQIAINQFSDKEGSISLSNIKAPILQTKNLYKKIVVRDTGALINTSYALQLLKMYCASLRQPNKPRFYYIETPNIAYRCIIYFPQTAPVSKPYIIGSSCSSKDEAQKSAAFEAIKYLYLEKYIKSDLRPKKYQQLQEEKQIEKYEDLEYTHCNDAYRKIFQEEVRIKCEKVAQKKFMRFYFRSIPNKELDFTIINPQFNKQIDTFKTEKFQFQLYMMNFTNSKNLKDLKKNENENQVGLLTCFDSRFNDQLFTGYQFGFEETANEKFSLKLINQTVELDAKQYERLKKAHHFLISTALGREIYHYSKLSSSKPLRKNWSDILQKQNQIVEDETRNYFPLLVVLKNRNGNYEIDDQCIRRLEEHEEIFKEVYLYHNTNAKKNDRKFDVQLSKKIEELNSEIEGNRFDCSLLVQSFEKQNCFHKCIVSGKEPLTAQMAKQLKLEKRKEWLEKNLPPACLQLKEVIKVIFWSKYKKEKLKEIFERDGKLSIKEVENPKYYFISQFLILPFSSSFLFKITLAAGYLFKALHEYTIAFSFRTLLLPNIIKKKCLAPTRINSEYYQYKSYPNVVIENGIIVFNYLAENCSSFYLRKIGKTFDQGTKFQAPSNDMSFTKLNIMDESSISYHKTEQLNDSINMSQINFNNFLDMSKSAIRQDQIKIDWGKFDELSLALVSQIKVTEILKVLTTTMYKHNKSDNYEEYEFIGDVVLKLLTTIEVFLEKPADDESSLHIQRANIICNANLHRKSILNHFYKYILTKKPDELPPPFQYYTPEHVGSQFYENTNIKKWDKNAQLQGFNYIPAKVHADIVEALIGAFYLHSKDLNDCQSLLYFLGILQKPKLKYLYDVNKTINLNSTLPKIYSQFQERIGYSFKNRGLLMQAFTHSSFKNILHQVVDKDNIEKTYRKINKSLDAQTSFLSTSEKQLNNNINTKIVAWQTFYERFEFLGDSILDLIVVQYIKAKNITKDEGALTALKQAGVNNRSLGMIAINYGMHELILMDYPENDETMKQFNKIVGEFETFLNDPDKLIEAKINSIKVLGDVFEALVGAIFIDLELDYQATKEVVMRIMGKFLEHFTQIQTMKKSCRYKLQQYLDSNNYKQCQIKKNTNEEIINGKYHYYLIDKSGAVVDECWEATEKKAWDAIVENFYLVQKAKKI